MLLPPYVCHAECTHSLRFRSIRPPDFFILFSLQKHLLQEKEESSLQAQQCKNCGPKQRVNCGRHYVLIRAKSPVRLRNVCHTCTDVSSIPHIVFLESMYIVKRIMVFV